MAPTITAYLHYVSIVALFALLILEFVQFKQPLELRRARRLICIDLTYGVCAGVVLLTGLAQVIWYGKGLDYYLSNGLFIAKVGLFVLVGMISTVPTFVFINWRNELNAGRVPLVSPRVALLVSWVIRLELLMLLIILVLAVLMARGYGNLSEYL